MRRDRRTGRQRPPDGPPPGRPAGRPDGRRKVTLYLPAELVRQLKHLAVDTDQDLGELAAPKLRELVGQRYQIHRRPDAGPADPLRIAAPEGLAEAG